MYSRGLYHGLPTFPQHKGRQYTALVLGASGITGACIIRALSRSPHWKTIFAVSRSKPHEQALSDNVVHLPIDLLSESDAIAEAFEHSNIKPYGLVRVGCSEPQLTMTQGLCLLRCLHPTQDRTRRGFVVQHSRDRAHQRYAHARPPGLRPSF